MKKKSRPQIIKADLEEIAEKTKDGFTSGVFDNGDGAVVSWELFIEKFNSDES